MERMHRRCFDWDYRGRAIYMVTVTAFEHRPLFGELVGGEARPEIRRSALGEVVARCWEELPTRYPGVRLLASVVMPDHFHGVLFVQKAQEKPLGAMVGFLKAHTTSLFFHGASAMAQATTHGASAPAQGSSAQGVLWPVACGGRRPIWAPGYHDRILFRRGQLERMVAYVRDNPRRLAVKRAPGTLQGGARSLACGAAVCGHRQSLSLAVAGAGAHSVLAQAFGGGVGAAAVRPARTGAQRRGAHFALHKPRRKADCAGGDGGGASAGGAA